MKSKILDLTHGAILATAVLAAPMVMGEDKPTPTPTPRPSGGQSLTDVAKDKELKGKEDGKTIVISNQTVADNSGKGNLTTGPGSTTSTTRQPVRRGMSPSGGMVQTVDSEYSSIDEEREKTLWRGKYESELRRIEALQYQLDLLDREIPGMWQDFYSRDDPAYRDGVIKPKLDAALEKRASIEKSLNEAKPKLDEIKDQARKAGGTPGWFRGLTAPTPPGPTPTPNIVIDSTKE